jgi:hypothetical protein
LSVRFGESCLLRANAGVAVTVATPRARRPAPIGPNVKRKNTTDEVTCFVLNH